ncbi:RICIN domain-containing protein [Actinacidiphila paucisporea]|uniref:Ricin-type beta-trefoil lectin domain-like n=1 Tax=Actinacidiphila paucisporea TaxID=310782 RepID=A0A1M7P1J4_9ACTN|nr:RICIN domain-containing protein [Actinacidiphila paucisporea]SHN10270.1 Ricin-type beta-trefoil lectin domain-like [Actinacidiphila paucisporea]
MRGFAHFRPGRPLGRAMGLGAATLTAATAALVGTSAQAAPTPSTTLVVNANQVLRPVTHVATGSLYGLANATTPADSLVQAIKPNTFVQKPQGGHQQGTGDVLTVAPKAARAGAKVVNRLSDYYAGWPYQFSWSNWLSVVDDQIAQTKASGITNLAAYAPWNESDNTWKSANGTFEDFWTTTYREIRAKDATTPIQGPSFSDNISDMQNFLQHAVATNTVPDIIAWHELIRSSKIAGDITTVTNLEKSLGISPRPIAIEEYAAPSEVGIPGALVGYVAKFERLGVHDAELAFWNQSGALGDLLTGQGGSPNGAYWLYKWYADMSGSMLTTTAPAQTGIDGAASRNSAGNEVDVIFGGGSGDSAVQVNGLNALPAFGSTVHVKVEYTPSRGRTTAVSGPITLSESNYAVTNGSLTVPVTTNSSDGYHLVITPGSGGGSTPLDGNYRITNKNSGLALDTQNSGTAQGTLVDQATLNSSSTQTWTLVSAGSGLYKIRNQASGLLLGITNAGTSDGGTALIWGDNGTADHLWSPVPDGTGYYKIVNSNSHLLLGVQNMSTSSGAQVLQWDDNGTADHLWKLTAQ